MHGIELHLALAGAHPGERRRLLAGLGAATDADALAVLGSRLGDPSPAVGEGAADALARLGGEPAAAVAALHLESGEPRERGYAQQALIRIGAPAVPVCLALLAHPDADVRAYAVGALAGIADPRTLPALLGVVRGDPEVTVAAAAAEALGSLGTAAAVPVLADAVESGPEWVRLAAIGALGRIGGAEALEAVCDRAECLSGPALAAAVEAVERASDADPARATAFLIRVLARADMVAREQALIALGGVLERGPVPPLDTASARAADGAVLGGLRSPRGEVRTGAARTLALVAAEHPGAAELLIRPLLAGDPEPAVRVAGLRAMAELGRTDSARCAALARDPAESPGVRRAALLALARAVAAGRGDAAWAEALLDPAHPTGVRAAAVELLAAGKDPRAVTLAEALLDDPATYDEPAAVAALERMIATGGGW